MRRHRSKELSRWVWGPIMLFFLALAFTIAYFLTSFIQKLFDWHIPAVLLQLLNSFIGLILAGSIVSLFTHIFKIQQEKIFTPIIEALEQIARGDFNIHLGDDYNVGRWKDLADSVNKMALQLGQMETMREEFVSNVSHEIQSPLTSIRGFAQVLQDEKLSVKERQHYLEIIEMESRRLSRIADDLLRLTSLDSDQTQLKLQNYRLDRQIRSLILTCEPQWTDKQIEVETDLDEVLIQADEDMLSQVWQNLLHNSIKFTPPGGKISVKLLKKGDWIELTLRDNGIGISSEDKIHIFERFYKADKSRTQKKEGSGLGLAIVKKIVELHHGRIDVQSELGKGTTFTIFLPAK
jgi:two-component system phosphate regulon sensor histidine kinase PhoR